MASKLGKSGLPTADTEKLSKPDVIQFDWQSAVQTRNCPFAVMHSQTCVLAEEYAHGQQRPTPNILNESNASRSI